MGLSKTENLSALRISMLIAKSNQLLGAASKLIHSVSTYRNTSIQQLLGMRSFIRLSLMNFSVNIEDGLYHNVYYYLAKTGIITKIYSYCDSHL